VFSPDGVIEGSGACAVVLQQGVPGATPAPTQACLQGAEAALTMRLAGVSPDGVDDGSGACAVAMQQGFPAAALA
jgi:hypothetical protein